MKDCLLLYGPVFVDIGPFSVLFFSFFYSISALGTVLPGLSFFFLPALALTGFLFSLPCNLLALSLHHLAFLIVINKLREIGEYEGNSSYVRCIVVNLFYCWKLLK